MFLFTSADKKTLANNAVGVTIASGNIWVAEENKTVEVFKGTTTTISDTNLITTIDLSPYFTNDCINIVAGFNEVFVFEEELAGPDYVGEFITAYVRISTLTMTVTDYVTLPTVMHCNPIFTSNALWFTTPAPLSDAGADTQTLYRWDVVNETADSTSIVANKQFEPMNYVWGFDQYLHVLSFNESAVIKFNDADATLVSTNFIDRQPTSAYANSNKDILVSSHNGIISIFDQTLDTDTQTYVTTQPMRKFVEETDHIWGIDNAYNMERVDKVQTGSPLAFEVLIEDGGTDDYSIKSFNTGTLRHFNVIPSVEIWNDTGTGRLNTKKLYIFTSDTDMIVCDYSSFTDSWDLYDQRDYTFTARGTAMIATGAQKYYGETE